MIDKLGNNLGSRLDELGVQFVKYRELAPRGKLQQIHVSAPSLSSSHFARGNSHYGCLFYIIRLANYWTSAENGTIAAMETSTRRRWFGPGSLDASACTQLQVHS